MGLAGADPGARTPIGASGNSIAKQIITNYINYFLCSVNLALCIVKVSYFVRDKTYQCQFFGSFLPNLSLGKNMAL